MQKRKLNDLALIKGFKNGDSEIIKLFYSVNYAGVSRFVKRNGGTNEDAKDVMQEGLYGTLLSLNSSGFSLQKSLGAYFYIICKNIWLTRIKEKIAERKMKEGLMIEADLNKPGEEKRQEELVRLLVFKHMQSLREECREILSMYLQNKPFKVIAEEMNLSSEGAARFRKKACLDKLLINIKEDKDFKNLNNEGYL